MRTSKLLSFSILLTLATGSLLLGGCRSKTTKSDLSTRNIVVWHNLSDPDRLNPYTSTDASASYIQQKIWEPLNFQNPETLELIPGMASLPEISEDHLTYTYTMNPKAHWSDGKPLTGEDVIFSYKTVLNPLVINSQALRGYFGALDSVTYTDETKTKLAFHLNKPYYDARTVLGGGYVSILPKHIFDPKNLSDKMKWTELKQSNPSNPAIKEFASFFESSEIARDPKFQIGSGPYVFKEWATFDHITLKRDPNYWAQDMKWLDAHPEEIMWKTINDQNAAFTALKAKDVDLIDGLRPEQYLSLNEKQYPFITKDTVYYNAYSFIAWNSKRPIFQSKNTRKALTALIDRDQIIQYVLKGLGRKTDGPVLFTQPNFNPKNIQVAYDPDAAKAMLRADGWADADGDGILDKMINGKRTPFSFTFQVNSGNEVRRQVLLIISEAYRKAGIDAKVSPLEWSVFLENTKSHNYDAVYSGWAGNAGEGDLYQLWHSSQSKNKGSNYYSFRNDEADALMTQIRTEFDPEKRREMAYRLQAIITDEQPVSFLYASPLEIGRVDRFDNVDFYRQRPCFDVRYWKVRGAEPAKPKAAGF